MKRKVKRARSKAKKPELDAIDAFAARIKKLLAAPKDKSSILPEIFTAPAFFAAIGILPELVLIAINAHAYSMVRGMENTDHGRFAILFVSGSLLTALFAAFALIAIIRKKRIAWGWHWLFLAAGIAYLWFVNTSMDTLIPRSVEDWIVPRGELLYLNFLCVMPVIFYSLIRLSSISIPVAPAMQWGIIGGSTVAIPLGWYLAAITVFKHSNLSNGPVLYIVAAAMVASTAALFFGLFRALVFFIHWYTAKDRRNVSIFLSAIVGLVMPIAGLLLNITFTFPADFQRPWFYILAILNGAALIIPATGRKLPDTVLFYARCVLFAYTAYFFLVFLPFYPLAVPLVFAFGSGFLVLTPALLFVMHGKRILDEYRSRKGRRTMFAALAAVLAIPVIITAGCFIDRSALHSALAHVYESDHAKAIPYGHSRNALSRALINLNEMNNGRHIPFITGWYNRIVFGGLTLADDRTDTLHRLFTGRPLPELKHRDQFGDFFFNARPRRILASMARPVEENERITPRIGVTRTTNEGAYTRSTVTFTLRNGDHWNEEYRTAIDHPDGVFIGGYRLRIGTTNVPGRITEKRTALWIYAMIVSRQADPGVLFYRAPNSAVLRVFPFTNNETRVTEIDFIHPAGTSLLRIGERTITLTGKGTPEVLRSTTPDGTSFLVPASVKARYTPITRDPYVHFIVDRSLNGPEDITNRMRSILTSLNVRRFRVSYANYDVRDDGVLYQANAVTAVRSPLIPLAGGFDVNRAVKHALLAHSERASSTPTNAYRLMYPVIVVITGAPVTNEMDISIPGTNRAKVRHQLFLATDTLDYFERLAPESPYYYISVPERKELTRVSFGRPSEEVLLLSAGNTAVVPYRGPSIVSMRSPDLSVFNEKSAVFTPMTTAAVSGTYASALNGISLSLAGRYAPSRIERDRRSILSLSKTSGVMFPSTSYIVVETSAQNRMIDEIEKKKMENPESADISKSPEPPIIALVIAALAIVLISAWRRKNAARL